MVKGLTLATLLFLSACQTVPVDTFCRTHKQSDFTPSRATVQVMTETEKRNTLKILKEGEKRCGWRA